MKQALKIAKMVEVDIYGFLTVFYPFSGEAAEAFIQHVATWIFELNGEEDPSVRINNPLITEEVIEFYDRANLLLNDL